MYISITESSSSGYWEYCGNAVLLIYKSSNLSLRWPRNTLYPQRLALTSPTGGDLSVGIVISRTPATEFLTSNCRCRHTRSPSSWPGPVFWAMNNEIHLKRSYLLQFESMPGHWLFWQIFRCSLQFLMPNAGIVPQVDHDRHLQCPSFNSRPTIRCCMVWDTDIPVK
jgi:hypothetical protein